MIRDLRFALRAILKNPGFAAVAIVTIGLGIGASTTIFSWMRTVVLNPLPGASQPDRVVAIENTADNGDPLTTSYLDYRDYRDHLRLTDLALKQIQSFTVGEESHPERVWGEVVSGNFFDLLGVQPELGRFFRRDESGDEQNAHPLAVISHSYWMSHYNGRSDVLGSKLRLNRTVFTVIGVAPPNFHGSYAGLNFEIWTPITMYGQITHTGTWMLEDRNTRNFVVLGRLKPGVSIEQARHEIQALAAFMAKANADSDQGIGADILPLWKSHFGAEAILLTPIAILMGASGLMLLIVCANVANLLLARATARRKEFSIRMALGARPARLTRGLLTETLLLALAGSAAGLLIAVWLNGSLSWLMPTVSIPLLMQPPLDAKILLFSSGLAFLVALLAGGAPALSASRANINEVLKESGRGAGLNPESHRMRSLLVVAEVALAVTGLIGAGLFLKNFKNARGMNPGFDPEGVALAQFDFSTAGYTARQADAFSQRLRERLEQMPGVTAVSYDDSVPLGFRGGNWESLEIEGYLQRPGERMKIYRDMVAPGFFNLLKIPLVEGRDFTLQDSAEKLHNDPIQKVMIVNQEFVRRFFAGRDPIGHKVHGWGEWFTIVGVVKDAKYHQITESPEPYFYIPIRQVYRPEYGTTFLVRTSGSVTEAIAAIRREAARIDPELLVLDAQPMSEYISASLFGQKIAASLLSVLGGLSLLLAAVGLYSVMAYSVAQRTSEIGIRMTLGARPSQVMSLILQQGMKMALAGLVLGGIVTLVAVRLVASALAAVSPADPIVYLGAALFATTVALLAAAIPAWRALRVDPMVALRCE